MAENEEERELDEMQERSERLEDEIEATREDWERKKRDPSVPGASGDPESADTDTVPEADEGGRD
jgi:hypothetical protein